MFFVKISDGFKVSVKSGGRNNSTVVEFHEITNSDIFRVGKLVFDSPGAGIAIIGDFSIDRDFRGKGWARKCLTAFFELANGFYSDFRLLCSPRDSETSFEGLSRLYQSFGFVWERTGKVENMRKLFR